MGWKVYLMRCGDGSLYTGITNDLPRRLRAHQEGNGAKYTRGRGPLTIAWSSDVPGKPEALRLEAKIKKMPKELKEKLVLSSNPLLEMLTLCPESVMQDEATADYSYAIPTEDAIRVIAELSPIVEMGAGTGYWAKLLRDAGADVVAYDRSPPGATSSMREAVNLWHPASKMHSEVLVGEPKDLVHHKNRALLLCWPPRGPMAAECLKCWRGVDLVFIGELRGGATGDDEFFDLLEEGFRVTSVVEIPRWLGASGFMSVWSRI